MLHAGFAFSSCDESGPLFIAARGPLTAVTSLVQTEREQQWRQTCSVVVAHGLSRPVACGTFPDQGSTRVPLIGRQDLSHWTTREVLSVFSDGE